MNTNEKILYWVDISELDIPVIEHFGDYHYSLFIIYWSLSNRKDVESSFC